MNEIFSFRPKESEGLPHLIVSDGVTAKIASVIPAPSPARCTVVSEVNSRSSTGQPDLQDCVERSLSPERYVSAGQQAAGSQTHLGIRQHPFEFIIADESNTCFDRVSNNERAATRIEPCDSLRLNGSLEY